ncbi:MAG: hypothetical protein HOE18_08845, partial [Porticoccaceae bacterium]|nr:hypothetical protein [Porticoccaceae bacterium]
MNHQIKLVVVAGLVMLLNVANAAVLDEVIVTATKRGQSAQDVGISVTALSGEQTEALG